MKTWQRLIFYLSINVFLSAGTILVVLAIWDKTHPKPLEEQTTVDVTIPTLAAGAPFVSGTPGSGINTGQAQQIKEYQVLPNETMGEIAEKFGISLEDLLAVNGLKDPNSLSAGMVLFIPLTPEALPTGTTSPTRVQATQPAGGVQEAGVVINSVIGAGDLTSERVFISRTGGGVLLMAGWKLRDEDGNLYTLPNLELYEGGAVNIWTTSGTATVIDLYWGLQKAVWESGEQAALLDAQGNVKAVYQVP